MIAGNAYRCCVAWARGGGVVLFGVLLIGCADNGSSSPSEPDQGAAPDESAAAVDIVAGHFAESDDPNGLHFTEEEARCTSQHIVRSLGLVRLEELGLAIDAGTPPELSEPPLSSAEGDAVYAAIEQCIDVEGQLVAALAGGDATEGQLRCVARRYLETGLPRRALVSGYDPELNAEIDAAISEAGSQCSVHWPTD